MQGTLQRRAMMGGAAVGAPCLLLALVHFGVAGAARNCSTTSWGGVQLDFRRRPPHDARAAPLKACRAMSAYTCCGPSDDASILAAQRAYLAGEGTPTACSRIAATVLCTACHGEFGTGRISGVLPSMCSDWCVAQRWVRRRAPAHAARRFAACADLWFAATEGSQTLRPCLNSDLVCAKLRDIVSECVCVRQRSRRGRR